MSISKIKEINKKLDKLMDKLGFIPVSKNHIKKCKQDRKQIKSFYTQQILSLIEELEGKLPKYIKTNLGHIGNDSEKIYEAGIISGHNSAIDQMRASIKELKNDKGVK